MYTKQAAFQSEMQPVLLCRAHSTIIAEEPPESCKGLGVRDTRKTKSYNWIIESCPNDMKLYFTHTRKKARIKAL